MMYDLDEVTSANLNEENPAAVAAAWDEENVSVASQDGGWPHFSRS